MVTLLQRATRRCGESGSSGAGTNHSAWASGDLNERRWAIGIRMAGTKNRVLISTRR